MKKILTVFVAAFFIFGSLSADNLKGFHYGKEKAPTGKEWESPEDLSLNKEQPSAWMFHFDTEANAKQVLPEKSPFWQSLDGTWKFH